MKHQTNKRILAEKRARTLRNNGTDAEKILWQNLRGRQIGNAKFRRQHPIGNYIVDFVSLEAKLIIELDGEQHHDQVVYDAVRDETLRAAGFRIIRLWNSDVFTNLAGVTATINDAIPVKQTS
jgi:very-short-patch-repair endonuclease